MSSEFERKQFLQFEASICTVYTAHINPLGAMLIYICMRMPTAHRDAHIYMDTLLTNAYHA